MLKHAAETGIGLSKVYTAWAEFTKTHSFIRLFELGFKRFQRF